MSDNHAYDQALAQIASIRDMVERLQSDDEETADQASIDINDDPLSIEIRTDWHLPGPSAPAAEYRIVLCTGGPHVEIQGDLDDHKQPETAMIVYKDWGTSDSMTLSGEELQDVLTYARQFWYGE